MKDSYNVLFIESMEMQEDPFGSFEIPIFVQNRFLLNYSIKMNCPITGNLFRELAFETTGESSDYFEAQRKAIQNMIDGRHSGATNRIFDVDSKCKPVKKIHHLEVSHFPKEIQDMFRQLFDISTWEFELKTINESNNI